MFNLSGGEFSWQIIEEGKCGSELQYTFLFCRELDIVSCRLSFSPATNLELLSVIVEFPWTLYDCTFLELLRWEACWWDLSEQCFPQIFSQAVILFITIGVLMLKWCLWTLRESSLFRDEGSIISMYLCGF